MKPRPTIPSSSIGAFSRSRSTFDLSAKSARADELERRLGEPGAWDDPGTAGRVAREAAELRDEVQAWDGLTRRAEDLIELWGLADGDESMSAQLSQELSALDRELQARELDLLFTDPYSSHNAVVSITAGQGGIEAQDWVEMLMRMYLKWAQSRSFAADVLDEATGEEAGLKGATFVIRGPRAYGLLRSEHGVHRLVRISPFDQQHRRHTSFALVEVMPELEEAEEAEIEIDPDDLRIDRYRSTGAGGQHVNKTDSAVRITHVPTGIVVTCQNERSQMKNRDMAMRILRSRLLRRRQEEAARQREELRGDVMPAEFGSQIRNYVLQPYTLVKDVRTGVEVGNAQAVLDGEVDTFIEGWLRWRLSQDGA
ncbi:MAG: peptide chain release factor 2 [Candidatus Dormibacterales bacterium]